MVKKHIGKKLAQDLAKQFHIDLHIIPLDVFQYGLNVELEHGSKFGTLSNITNDDLLTTTRIVIAHLLEYPDYYQRLKKMETMADQYWSNKQKPNIFNYILE
jgi:hypothetical protein